MLPGARLSLLWQLAQPPKPHRVPRDSGRRGARAARATPCATPGHRAQLQPPTLPGTEPPADGQV